MSYLHELPMRYQMEEIPVKKTDSETQLAETEQAEQAERADTRAVKARKYTQRQCTRCGRRFSAPEWRKLTICDDCWVRRDHR